MARTPAVAGGRVVTVCVRLSEAEAALLDNKRRGLSRSEHLRSLLRAQQDRISSVDSDVPA